MPTVFTQTSGPTETIFDSTSSIVTTAQFTGGVLATGFKGDKGDKGDTGVAGVVQAVVGGTNITVDSTDPANPEVNLDTLTVTDISDVTATSSELNVLDGITATTTELNYTDGVTSAIQTQLDAKVPTSRTVNGSALSSNITLDADDIDDTSTTHKFVTSSDLTKLSNTSGTNTGDQDLSGLVPKTTTVNGNALSGNITLDIDDVAPAQTGNSGKVLKTDGTNATWQTETGGGGAVDSVNGQTGVVVLDSDDISEGSTNLYLTGSERTKLSNTSGTNTGDQDLSGYALTSSVPTALTDLDTTVTGSQLNSDHSKLAGIEAGAEVNVQSDWDASSGDAQILNKPTLGTAAAADTTDFATAAQGSTADTALQSGDLPVITDGERTTLNLVTPGFASIDFNGADVQIFDTAGSHTWTKPDGVTLCTGILIGGGGGGASGRRGAAGTNRYGGGGGAGGASVVFTIPAALLGSTENVTVGAGGTGAAPQTVDNQNGTEGGTGGASSFGGIITALPGNGGYASSSNPAASRTPPASQFLAGTGGSAAIVQGIATATGGTGNTGGGSAGGYITDTDTSIIVVGAGGAGSGGIGGGSVMTPGAPGNDGTSGTYGLGGGGGSGGHVAAKGGNGGNNGGGGGGGGASTNGTNSGGGGNGGNGWVQIVSI